MASSVVISLAETVALFVASSWVSVLSMDDLLILMMIRHVRMTVVRITTIRSDTANTAITISSTTTPGTEVGAGVPKGEDGSLYFCEQQVVCTSYQKRSEVEMTVH